MGNGPNNLPDGWSSEPLARLATRVMVGIASAATHAYRTDGVVLLRNMNIKENSIDDRDLLFIDPDFEKLHSRKRLRTGDVITVRTGNPGVSAVVPARFDGAQCFTSLITRPKPDVIQSHFLCMYINSSSGVRQVNTGQAGGAQQNVNASTLGRLLVPVPPVPEQNAIVRVLMAWERSARLVESLIKRRRKLKRGLLQQLLTGQRRFPEFRKQPWVERPLSAFFTEVDVSNANGAEKLVLSCTKLYGIISQMERFERRIASASISHYKVVKRGQLVYDPMLLWDRSIGFVKGYDSGVVSPAYATFAINSELADPDFFEALFDSHFMRHQYKVISKGTNQRRRKAEPRDFLGVRVLVPPTVEEQRRIGEFVKTCDQELDGLKALHSALKEQKKGLMQKLLTGQVRVPASMMKEASHA